MQRSNSLENSLNWTLDCGCEEFMRALVASIRLCTDDVAICPSWASDTAITGTI